MKRRNFILASAAGLLGSQLGFAEEKQNNKSVIFVFLHGGASHIEFTHAHPDVPVEMRSVSGSIQTKAGYLLGGHFTGLASHSSDVSVVKSFHHKDGNHSTAAAWVLTSKSHLGVAESGDLKEPSYGSLVSRFFGNNTEAGLPTYVKTNKIDYAGARRDAAAWLGSNYVGFDVDSEGLRNLELGIEPDRMKQRMDLVKMVDIGSKDPRFTEYHKGWTDLRSQAYNIAMGKARQIFDTTKELLPVQTAYNSTKSDFGKSLLMARRLVQNGSRFVSVSTGGWDMHNEISKGMDSLGPQLDAGLSALTQDLKSQGLLNDTMVVVTTEFGRTYKINVNAGRDHWNQLVPLIFIGGGYNHGREIGKAEKNGSSALDNGYSPADLCATVMDHLAIPRHTYFYDNLKRPHHLFESEARNILA